MLKKYIFFLLMGSLIYTSCTDSTSIDELGPVVKLGAVPNITSPDGGRSFVFTEEEATKALPTVTWTPADFGYPAAVTYNLELDKVGNNFEKAISLGVTSGLSLEGLTEGELNNVLFAQGYPELEPIDMEMRVVATVSDEVAPLISTALPYKLTLYEVIIVYPQLQLPGDYQGWDPATPLNIIFSLQSNRIYEGYNYFGQDAAIFKFTDGPSWDLNWGDNEPDGILDEQGIGNDIPTGGDAGVYFLTCNLRSFTYTIVPSNWTAIGSSTGGSDVSFEYDAENNQLSATTDLETGDFKFRANEDDAMNLGDAGSNGKLLLNAAGVSVTEAGNYTINLKILNVPEPTFELIKN